MMKALILAGGLGTRLRPLTYKIPKCLLTINNKTILEHQLELLEKFDEVILATNYLENKIKNYLSDINVSNVIINNEPERLGTAGAILNAREILGKEFVVLNGDIITNFNIGSLLDSGPNSILVQRVDDISRYGNVIFEGNKVHKFREKADIHSPGWINAGLYYLDRKIFDFIPMGRPVSIEREVFPALSKEGKMKVVMNDCYWHDVGTKDDFINANLSLSGKDCVIGRNCKVTDSIISRSVIMDGCDIEDSSIIDSIIGPNNNISGANVENKIMP